MPAVVQPSEKECQGLVNLNVIFSAIILIDFIRITFRVFSLL